MEFIKSHIKYLITSVGILTVILGAVFAESADVTFYHVGDEIRTHTIFLSLDFKSSASTCSATPTKILGMG